MSPVVTKYVNAAAIYRGSAGTITIANRRIKVTYSTSKRIVQRPPTGGNPEDASGTPAESRVLLLTIYNAQYPITVEVINQITARHGRVARVVIFRKTHIQVSIFPLRSMTMIRQWWNSKMPTMLETRNVTSTVQTFTPGAVP